MSQVHPQARTTPRTRAEIKTASGTLQQLADRYNVSVATARKWKGRDEVQDRSHRPHKLSTVLTPGQEAVVIELRRSLLLPLDDLLVVTHEFINPLVSRSGLDRCLRRHNVSRLRDLQVVPEGAQPCVKTFKDYEPGYVHVDIKYLPQTWIRDHAGCEQPSAVIARVIQGVIGTPIEQMLGRTREVRSFGSSNVVAPSG